MTVCMARLRKAHTTDCWDWNWSHRSRSKVNVQCVLVS